MKHKNFIIKLLLLLVLPLTGFVRDKCNYDKMYNELVKKMKKYTVLKDYRLYMKKNKNLDAGDYQYFTIPLNRGVKYKFAALNSDDYEGKLIINLYNNPQKEFLFATTLTQGTGTIRESLEFKCQSTGNFCIGYYFLDGVEGCAIAASAFQQE